MPSRQEVPMSQGQRRRTLMITAVAVSLMMLFLGGRAFALHAGPPDTPAGSSPPR